MKFGMHDSKKYAVFEKIDKYFFRPLLTILMFIIVQVCFVNEDLIFAYTYLFASVIYTFLMGLSFFDKGPYRSKHGIPLFEINDETLFYKTTWGNIKEYPLSAFKGKIETRPGDNKYLLLPNPKDYTGKIVDFSDFGKSLYIGALKSTEREALLRYLMDKVESDKNPNRH